MLSPEELTAAARDYLTGRYDEHLQPSVSFREGGIQVIVGRNPHPPHPGIPNDIPLALGVLLDPLSEPSAVLRAAEHLAKRLLQIQGVTS
jgi:hypothetical protein